MSNGYVLKDENELWHIYHYGHMFFCTTVTNRIGAVMVIVLASSAVDRGLESRSGQTRL